MKHDFHALASNPRICADIRAPLPGPTVVVVGAIHGNEPAGLLAIRALAETLRLGCGRLIGLIGNTRALAKGVRFIDGDLNRRFTREVVARVRHGEYAACDSEDLDQADFLKNWDEIRSTTPTGQPLVLVDLHTFSAAGTPFAMAGTSPMSLDMARASGLPTLLQLQEHLPGTMVELGVDDGIPVLAMEGGQHDDPGSVAVLAGAIFRICAALGMEPSQFHASPAPAHPGVPALLDIVYRHAITPADAFRMRPGWRNLTPVGLHAVVADDRHGPVRTPVGGWMVMPLYQGQGADGFFLATAHPAD